MRPGYFLSKKVSFPKRAATTGTSRPSGEKKKKKQKKKKRLFGVRASLLFPAEHKHVVTAKQ